MEMTPTQILSIGKKLHRDNRTFDESGKAEIRTAALSDKGFINFVNKTQEWDNEKHDQLNNLLDLEKNEVGFYKDIFGQGVSYNGIRTLRRAKSVLPTTKVHRNEMEKCANSFKYFRQHYVKIVTRDGIRRPEPRDYQERLENELISLEDVVILYPRQSGKTVTTGTYLLWLSLFHDDPINIGIVGNSPGTAAEVLDKIKKIFIELPIWMQRGIEVWNKGSIEFDNGTRLMTDGPSSDAFRGYTINILYCDEVAYYKKSEWDEFVDSVMPTMNSLIFKQIIMTSTANGMNHFENLVKQAKRKDTSERFIETSWRNVPHYKKDGTKFTPDEYKKFTIKKYSKKFFAQTEECEFLGSSDTLVDGAALKNIEERIAKRKLIPQVILNEGEMYKEPQENHSYLITCDPSKDGIDDFSVNVTDVTCFPFEQVFSANLQVDYLIMPEHLNELGLYFNEGLMIIENNEGAGQSISDVLFSVYEYPNMYRDKNIDGKIGYKRFTGFRTTLKSRPLILNMLKIFVEEGKLLINSQTTLNQLYTFTKRKTGNKYEAEDGYKDDAVMSLALLFAPFMSIKVFDNFELFSTHLRTTDSTLRTAEFLSVLDIGGSDDGSEDDYLLQQKLDEQRKFLEAEGLGGQYAAYEDLSFDA